MTERRRVHADIDQVVLRTMVVLGTMLVVVAATGAGARPPQWLQVSLLALALLVALRPDSALGVALLLGSAYAWSLAPEPLAPEVLLVAAGMLLAHLAALVAAQGPARMRVDLRHVGRWAARGLVLWAGAAAVWGLAVLMADQPGNRPVYAAGLVLLAATATAATWVVAGGRASPH